MPIFNVRFTYLMVCETKGYTIEAEDEEEANRKCEACITKDGYFDADAFEAAGGDYMSGSWGTIDGSDYNYEFDDEWTEEDK